MSAAPTRTTPASLDTAAEWRLIALLFEYPGPGWLRLVAGLGAEVRDSTLRMAADAAKTEASEGVHQSIFGPGGPVPPREVTYLGGVQFGYLLSELSAFYDAFGYQPAVQEPVDHVAVEAGFVAYLALKETYARLSGDSEAADVASEAASSFRAEHLATLAHPLAEALEAGGPPYLALAARALRDRVGPPPRKTLPLIDSPDDTEVDEVSCPSAS